MAGGRKQTGYVGRKPGSGVGEKKPHKHEVWPGVQVGPDAYVGSNSIKPLTKKGME